MEELEPEPLEPPPRQPEIPQQHMAAPPQPQRAVQSLAPIRNPPMTQQAANDPPPYPQQNRATDPPQQQQPPQQQHQAPAAWSQGAAPAGPYQAGSPLQRGPYQVAPMQAQRPAFSARSGITGAHQYVPPTSQPHQGHRPASALGAGAQYMHAGG